MASEQETQSTTENNNESILSILAMLGGLGIIVMVGATGYGVVMDNADSGIIGMFLMAGAGLLAAGIAGWVIVVRPHENIDDISVGTYHGHHHDDHDDHADESHSEH